MKSNRAISASFIPGNKYVLRVAFLALMILIDVSYTEALAKEQANATISGSGHVTYVIDGDTLIIKPDSREKLSLLYQKAVQAKPSSSRSANLKGVFDSSAGTYKARIGNIDTPESVHPDKSRNTAAGVRASKFARNLAQGEPVDFRCWDTGYFLRPICSVWIINESVDFASEMIKNNHTNYETKYGKHPFWHKHYESLGRK